MEGGIDLPFRIFLVFAVPALVATGFALLLYHRKGSFSSFFAADRNVGVLLGAVTVGVSWFWIFAYFVGPQKAYESGWPALAWFVIPNLLGIVAACVVARQVRWRVGDTGYTLPEFIGRTYGPSLRFIYALAIMVVQGVYAVLAQLVGATVLFAEVTVLGPVTLAIIIAILMTGVAVARGLPSSLVADVLKALLLISVIVLTVVALGSAGSTTIAEGMSGVLEGSLGFFDADLVMAFGIPVALSLIAGAVIDQQLYQRAFALSGSSARRGLLFAPLVFLVPCVAVGLLGFVAAGMQLSVSTTQNVGFEVMRTVFAGGVASDLFLVAVVAILIATGAAALNAAGSIGVVDVLRLVRPDAPERSLIWAGRAVMVAFSVLGVILVAQDVRLVDMLLFVGPFRAALLVPTILGAFTIAWMRPHPVFTIVIAGSMVLGVWMASGFWPLREFSSSLIFEAGIVVLGVTTLACVLEWFRSRRFTPWWRA